MRVLLQHVASHHYFSADGLWRRNAAQGRSFEDISLALSYCRAHEMFSANVILAFEDTDMNVCLEGPRQLRTPTENRDVANALFDNQNARLPRGLNEGA